MAFAKLFEVDGFGQVLAKLGTDDEGRPELRWFAEPPELGVCEFALGFEDNDDGWEKAESALAGADEDAAKKAAVALWRATGNMVPSNAELCGARRASEPTPGCAADAQEEK